MPSLQLIQHSHKHTEIHQCAQHSEIKTTALSYNKKEAQNTTNISKEKSVRKCTIRCCSSLVRNGFHYNSAGAFPTY